MLYCITLRPLFFRASTPRARIETLLHELFHISRRFDGSLEPTRRHATLGKNFTRELKPLVRRYLKKCPPELWAAFAYDGEVRMQQWLERPTSGRGQGKSRALYTEEHLFSGPLRMATKRTRAAHQVKAGLKFH